MKHEKHSNTKHDKGQKKDLEHAPGIEGQDAARHQGDKKHHPISHRSKLK